jgi:hypothetical protein
LPPNRHCSPVQSTASLRWYSTSLSSFLALDGHEYFPSRSLSFC